MDLVEILSFLFQLSFSTLGKVSRGLEWARWEKGVSVWDWERENGMCFGPQLATPFPQDYSVEGMSDSLLNFLQHLREFGLVFQRKV